MSKLEEIEKILVEEDPIGLIRIGSPSDEYNQEAEIIHERTSRHFSLETIHNIVYQVFVQQFSGGEAFKVGADNQMVSLGYELPSVARAKKIIGYYENYLSIAKRVKNLLDE